MGTAQEWSESEIAFAFFREFGFIKGTQLTFEDRLSKSRNQVDTLIKIETAIGLMRDVTGFLMILGGVNAAFYAKGGPYEKKD